MIEVTSIVRTNKGKGITVSYIKDGIADVMIMRKTGGEKYNRLSIQDCGPGGRQCFFVHKSTTRNITPSSMYGYKRILQIIDIPA